MSRRKVKAGEGYVEIGIRNRIAAGARGVQSDLRNLATRTTALGSLIGGVGLAMGTPFALAAAKLASFDDAMRSVGAVSQASDDQLKTLTATAKELGRTTSFTAVDVASLMIELGRAGFSPDQIDAMTSAVLNLARATGTEAPLAAGIMSASIRQFGLAATDADRVADALTAAANKSFNSVESLGQALEYAGPVAADFNMSIEETLANLGTLGNVGIQGSAAGTAVRRLLTLSGAEAKKLERIFGVTFVDSANNARPLVDALADVADATNGLGTATRAAKFNEAFGLLGITGASAISKTAASTRQLLHEIKAAGGIAARTSEEMDAGLGGSFRKIASAAEGVAIAVAESFGGSLKEITDLLTRSLGGVTAWIQENRSLVAAVAATSVAMVGAGAALISIGIASHAAAAGIGTLTLAVAAASSVKKAFVAVSAAVKAATLATAAAFAAASATAKGAAIGLALFNGAQAASPAIAALVVASWSAVGTALAALAAPSALATSLAGMVGTAWTYVAGVVTYAWGLITAPIAPFIIAGGAVVALLSAVAIGVAGLAVASIDFGAAWSKAMSMFSGAVRVFKDVFGTIRAALSAGEYATAAKAMWVGIRLAFWSGVAGAMDAFDWLWDQAKSTSERFFTRLLDVVKRVMGSIAKAIMNPFEAAKEIGAAIGELISSASSFDVGGRADAARAELAVMRQSLDIQKARTSEEKEAARIREESKSASQRRAEKLAQINRLENAGALTASEANAARDKVDREERDPFQDKVKAIELEILALRKGEQAANRKRLADEGLTTEQIRQIEALERKKKALEKVRDAQETADQRRVSGLFDKAEELEQRGVAPDEIFRRVMSQIKTDQDAGRISADTADEARDSARQNLDDRMDRLREEGRALAEALRTPAEILGDKLSRIALLQESGAITEKDALRAEDKARDEFKVEQENRKKADQKLSGIDEKQQLVGPSGTFSASAATIIGGGPRFENEQLAATKQVAENTRQLVKRTKKGKAATFSS